MGEVNVVRKVTIKDVAALAQTSVTTVSLILNNKGQRFSAETIARVRAAREKISYEPDYFAQNMVNKETKTIAVLVPDINNPFFSQFIQGVEEVAYQYDFIPLIYSAGQNNQKVNYYLKELVRRNVDGFILAVSHIEEETLEGHLKQRKIPYILLDQSEKQHQSDEIAVADTEGGRMAANYLIEKGHRQIGIVLPEQRAWNIEQRFIGYQAALVSHQITVNPDWQITTPLSKQGGYQVAQQVIDSGVSAVFAVNDELAIGLARGLAELGHAVPESISIIGYDDIDWCEYVTPRLTTIKQPILALGQEATRLLLNRIEKPTLGMQQKMLSVELVERDSVQAQ
ncbi:LacI family transcriptional regulator [Latilactobacillus sakei]|nr:LacI family transcriptional regulator [Latilactobacillus sakei]USF99377.1 LacI family transcriptional regulator [Latilactobacillus sakei subsp. sakei]BAX65758.1 ribose operon transcriptional regulator [Latilactobacillus sakei subsp. sakei DSM 20017 = JCM 1157]AWZ42533.1 LacI family transcriptional regulator [Latilactobacillus sakei]AWZ45260.1 LacI family transcriptional regulator [Latilactobacillus sakei]